MKRFKYSHIDGYNTLIPYDNQETWGVSLVKDIMNKYGTNPYSRKELRYYYL